jgi:hypothetical protein
MATAFHRVDDMGYLFRRFAFAEYNLRPSGSQRTVVI